MNRAEQVIKRLNDALKNRPVNELKVYRKYVPKLISMYPKTFTDILRGYHREDK